MGSLCVALAWKMSLGSGVWIFVGGSEKHDKKHHKNCCTCFGDTLEIFIRMYLFAHLFIPFPVVIRLNDNQDRGWNPGGDLSISATSYRSTAISNHESLMFSIVAWGNPMLGATDGTASIWDLEGPSKAWISQTRNKWSLFQVVTKRFGSTKNIQQRKKLTMSPGQTSKVTEFHHGAELHTADVAHDGKFFATAGFDGQVEPWAWHIP